MNSLLALFLDRRAGYPTWIKVKGIELGTAACSWRWCLATLRREMPALIRNGLALFVTSSFIAVRSFSAISSRTRKDILLGLYHPHRRLTRALLIAVSACSRS